MKRSKKKIVSGLSLLLSLILLLAFPLTTVFAVTQDEIDKLEEERDRLQEKVDEQQSVIDELSQTKSNFFQRKLALDAKIELNQQEIELIDRQVELYNGIISEKAKELEAAEAAENAQSELLRSRMRTMEENGSLSFFTFILQANSLMDLLSRIADANDIMHYDQKLKQQYMAAREDVQTIKTSYELTRSQQEELQKELDTKKLQLDAQVEAAYLLLANIDELADDAQAEHDLITKELDKANEEITAMLKKLAEEEAARAAAAAAAAAAEAAARGETTGGTTGGGGTSSGGNPAVSLSGLMWPVPSCTLITSRFGYRVSPTAGASTYHGGLDIGAQMGATIASAGAGEVIMAESYGGYGNCVMVNHGNGVVTLYGHMSSIAVVQGQYVTQGQLIGYVGSTGVSTGPHCHFEVRVNGSQTDPAQYFSGLSYYNC